jgi:DNA modification methylase
MRAPKPVLRRTAIAVPVATPVEPQAPEAAPRGLLNHTAVISRPLVSLRPARRNARTHSKAQIRQIAASIKRFGFVNPILIDAEDTVIAGHGRLAAAKHLGLAEVPTLRITHLSQAERRAYALADNQLALLADWDIPLLSLEIQELATLDIDLEVIGFPAPYVDSLLADRACQADEVPGPAPGPAVSRRGDLWELGPHRVLCGDAGDPADYARLLGGTPADVVFTDPPYNVKISGFAAAKGRHREFPMASGELSPAEFTAFLSGVFAQLAAHCRDGAVLFVCMDWRHLTEVLTAGSSAFTTLLNLCVWAKTTAGQGSLYRSGHELVLVYKHGTAAHTNRVELGVHGRHRTNVWNYPGGSSFHRSGDPLLTAHPTIKPVALVADALLDCSRRGDRVLDPFGGSGSTLIAAERTGRAACLMELDPGYVDLIVQRYQRTTGRDARLAGGPTFEAVASERTGVSEVAE